MHYLYVIYSERLHRYYVGETPNVEIRLAQHNNHYFKTNYTKSADDWKVLIKYECRSRQVALSLERFIKKMKSRAFIEKIVTNPKILGSAPICRVGIYIKQECSVATMDFEQEYPAHPYTAPSSISITFATVLTNRSWFFTKGLVSSQT